MAASAGAAARTDWGWAWGNGGGNIIGLGEEDWGAGGLVSSSRAFGARVKLEVKN